MDIEQTFELIFAARDPSGSTFVSALIDLAIQARLVGGKEALNLAANQEIGRRRRSESRGNATLAVTHREEDDDTNSKRSTLFT